MKNSNKNNIIKDIVETGSEISGGVVGAIIGGLIIGPTGGFLGGVSGPIVTKVFKKIGAEIQDRFLSPREGTRIGAAYAFAINKINENESKGLSLRNDDFFKCKDENRPGSEEILEGIILFSQREYEEQKIKYLGNLYANICYDSSVSKEHANQLIRTADSLSFRQFCILQLLNDQQANNQQLNGKIRKSDEQEISLFDIIAEIRDMQQKGLVHIPNTYDGGNISAPIRLNNLTITTSGNFFCKILSLEEIEKEKLDKINRVAKIQM